MQFFVVILSMDIKPIKPELNPGVYYPSLADGLSAASVHGLPRGWNFLGVKFLNHRLIDLLPVVLVFMAADK